MNWIDRLLKCIGLSRASVTSYYANAAEHNQRALEARISDIRWLKFSIKCMEIRYRQQCDKQAMEVLEKIMTAELGKQNDQLIEALTDSRGAQFAYAPEPTVELDPTL